MPRGTSYACLLNSDNGRWGGSEHAVAERVKAEATPWHGMPHSIELGLPPLAALVLQPEADRVDPGSRDPRLRRGATSG